MPLAFLLYLSAYLDRGNLGNAKVQGLVAAVLDGDDEKYSLVGIPLKQKPSQKCCLRHPGRDLGAVVFLYLLYRTQYSRNFASQGRRSVNLDLDRCFDLGCSCIFSGRRTKSCRVNSVSFS
jgi:hypothetical protein